MINWTPVTQDGYLEIDIINKAYEYQQYLKTLLMQSINRNVFLLEPDTPKGTRTIPFPEFINIIEKNLDKLWGSWRPSARKASIEWFGELLDQRFLDYTDVNRWFEMMQLLERLILTVPQRVTVTGTFRTGINHTRQIIKRKYRWNYVLDGSWRLGEKPFASFQ